MSLENSNKLLTLTVHSVLDSYINATDRTEYTDILTLTKHGIKSCNQEHSLNPSWHTQISSGEKIRDVLNVSYSVKMLSV